MATSLDVAGESIPTSTVLISVSKGENVAFNNCKKDDLNLEKCLEKGRHATCFVLSLVIDDKTKQGAVVAHPVGLEKVFFVAEEQGPDLMLVLITHFYWLPKDDLIHGWASTYNLVDLDMSQRVKGNSQE
ncbi:hypothetical protein Tco_1508577 [Tanacetum coccineum]